MPGVGKSYWAKKMSDKYGWNYVDMDTWIEQRAGQSVSALFTLGGEEQFRKLETQCLEEIITANKNKDMIVACGGGTPAFGNNITLMKKNGCVVYIENDISTLAGRIRLNMEERPLFSSGLVEEVLVNLYEQRKPYYKQADYSLTANEISLVNFDKIIELCTGRQ
jgi:shikimate kinase